MVVENIGGASGSIGTNAVATAPDGYTFGVVFDTHGTNASLIPNIAYDTLKDLEYVTLIGTSPMALVASAKSPYSKMADVTADARTIKGITIGSIGTRQSRASCDDSGRSASGLGVDACRFAAAGR